MRCFVAIEPDPAVRRTISRFIRERLPSTRDARWCGVDQIHITLKFLGDVDETRLRQVCDIVSQTAAELTRFELHAHGLGCFPPRGSPRVMWLGVDDPAGHCAKWVATADGRLTEFGFEAERRAFTPHITLGRAKNPAGGALLANVVETLDGPPPMTFRVQSLTLFESELTPAGARYSCVLNAPLAPG
jgi:2'-5' RNA ligase